MPNRKIIIVKKKSKSKTIKIIKKQVNNNNNDNNDNNNNNNNNGVINEYLNDSFLMEECVKSTEKLISLGMEIDSITKFIKTYQDYYIKFNKMDPTLSKNFTFEMFYKKCCKSM